MNIHDYIQSFTNIDKDNKTNKTKLILPNKNTKVRNSYSRISPFLYGLKNCIQTKLDDLGLNVLSFSKKRFKELQQKDLSAAIEQSSTSSDVSYTTASLASQSSFLTAIEDFEPVKNSVRDSESDISFDSGIDEGKRELITRLLQSTATDSFSEEDLSPDSTDIPYETQDLCDDIEIEQNHWDENISEQLMYDDRIFRFFQHTEQQNLNHNSLKKSPVCEKTRQYFMNLTDDRFCEFERRGSSCSLSNSQNH